MFFSNKKYPLPTQLSDGVNRCDNIIYFVRHGVFHRDDGPAVDWGNGSVAWYSHGKLHRIGGPALIYKDEEDEEELWYEEGQLHRDDGPARICGDSRGISYGHPVYQWYNRGVFFKHTDWAGDQWYDPNLRLHKEDGPALTYNNGSEFWFCHGDRHREDGPAVINAVDDTIFFYLNDIKYTPDEWFKMATFKSEEERILCKLKYM